VVVVSSLAHRFGKLDVANLSGTKKYRPWKAYGQSKLANLLFCLELKRRLEDMGTPTKVVAAHPGYAATNLQSQSALISIVNPLLGQSPKNGALPVLRAAVDPHVHSGEYYGPRWMFEIFGSPVVVGRSRAARDVDLAQQLWVESEDLTGVRWAEIFPEDRG
jgi:NAD(P)-dependent dehydrogenase (short-subunit alcohol dehydrogenase family)